MVARGSEGIRMVQIAVRDLVSAAEAPAERKAIPPFASLRAFEAGGRLGGIRRAATELCVDHAVVSRHLRGLEAWIGRALFDRSGSTPVLTTAGQQYHEIIARAMADIAQGTRNVVRLDRNSRILIWSVPGFASRWLAANIDQFMDLYPSIEIDLRPTDVGPNFFSDEADGDIRFFRDACGPAQAVGVTHVKV